MQPVSATAEMTMGDGDQDTRAGDAGVESGLIIPSQHPCENALGAIGRDGRVCMETPRPPRHFLRVSDVDARKGGVEYVALA